MDEKGQNKVSMSVVTLIAIAMLVIGGFATVLLTSPASITGAVEDGAVTPDNVTCELGNDVITMTVLSLSPDGVKSDVTSDYNFDVRDSSGITKDSGTGTADLTLSKLTSYIVHAFDKDSTHDVYYFNHSFATKCEASEPIVIEKGVEDTALTLVVSTIASGTETTNTTSAPSTLGAGATLRGELYIEATTANGAYSTANGGRQFELTLDYNASVFEQPTIVSVSNGTASAGQPARLSFSKVVSSSTQEVMFVITSDALVDLGTIEIAFSADARSATMNPCADDGNIGISVNDREGYLNDSLTYDVGFEDVEAGSDIGEAVSTDTFHTA